MIKLRNKPPSDLEKGVNGMTRSGNPTFNRRLRRVTRNWDI